jgi:hypothetical protein
MRRIVSSTFFFAEQGTSRTFANAIPDFDRAYPDIDVSPDEMKSSSDLWLCPVTNRLEPFGVLFDLAFISHFAGPISLNTIHRDAADQ